MTKAVTIINADQNEEKTLVVSVYDKGPVLDVGSAPDILRTQRVLAHPGDDTTVYIHDGNYVVIKEGPKE